ncbi:MULTISPECIES: DUF7160 family protein [Mycobacteriaceae]|uniref:DUF7160 family protein n=2 Tax=Mycobacteriaceae TaxID=1762 RepID=UPI003AF70933
MAMATPPAQAMCSECNQSARVATANPIWSHGGDEPSTWIVEVDCARCGLQHGWLPRR